MNDRLLPHPDYCTVVLIDAQDRLMKAMAGAAAAEHAMGKTLRTAGILGVDVVVTEQVPRALRPTTDALLSALPDGSPRLGKPTFSCWGDPAFSAALDAFRPRALVLAGMETHVCVQQTALEALARGYRVAVVADAVCSRRPFDRDTALRLLANRGVAVTTLEAIAFDWLRDSSDPRFKAVASVVKSAPSDPSGA